MNYDDALRKVNGKIVGSCFLGKTGWASKQRAKYAMKSMQSELGVKMRIYRCPHCKLFHLTGKVNRRSL